MTQILVFLKLITTSIFSFSSVCPFQVKKINDNLNYKCRRHPGRRSDSVLSSSDSDIRFTRRNLGENEKCGCMLIAGFLAALLLAGAIIYIGCKYFIAALCRLNVPTDQIINIHQHSEVPTLFQSTGHFKEQPQYVVITSHKLLFH